MSEFTPFSAMIGGMLIGGSAALLLLLIGRIAGITGIIGGILQPARGELGWRLAFVAGLLMAPVIHTGAGGALPPVEITSSTSLLILAGVLVGVVGNVGTVGSQSIEQRVYDVFEQITVFCGNAGPSE